MDGYGGGLFGPNDPVSREQMTAILWRYAGSPASDGAADYNDETAIASYAAAAVDWAALASSAAWLDGQRFSGGASRSMVGAWVNGLGLTLTPAA